MMMAMMRTRRMCQTRTALRFIHSSTHVVCIVMRNGRQGCCTVEMYRLRESHADHQGSSTGGSSLCIESLSRYEGREGGGGGGGGEATTFSWSPAAVFEEESRFQPVSD